MHTWSSVVIKMMFFWEPGGAGGGVGVGGGGGGGEGGGFIGIMPDTLAGGLGLLRFASL